MESRKRRSTVQRTKDNGDEVADQDEYEKSAGPSDSSKNPAVPLSERRILRAVRPSEKFAARRPVLVNPFLHVTNNEQISSSITVAAQPDSTTKAKATEESPIFDTDKKDSLVVSVERVEEPEQQEADSLAPDRPKPMVFWAFKGFGQNSTGNTASVSAFGDLFKNLSSPPDKTDVPDSTRTLTEEKQAQ